MKPVDNWNNVKPIMGGESNALPAGGYVCKIITVVETFSKSEKEMLVIHFDIAEGDYKDYYKKKYQDQMPSDPAGKMPTWKGLYYIVLDGENWEGRFKGFITSLEESNSNFKWENCNWDTTKLNGLLFGGVFREEEFQGNNGVAKNTKLYYVRNVEKIRTGDFKIPEPKLLETTNAPFTTSSEFAPVTDDDLPF